MARMLFVVFVFCILVVIIIPSSIAILIRVKSPSNSEASEILVLNHRTGKVMAMELEDYIIGVVAAEMPASFGLEALKAQAVAARTYTVKRVSAHRANPRPEHPAVPLCTDSSHCQAWSSIEDMLSRWGGDLVVYYGKIARAVGQTQGLVLVYGGLPIDAVYHASCGGVTEDAREVWGLPVPYLVPVACDPNSQCRSHTATRTVPAAELAAMVRARAGSASQDIVRIESYSSTMRVKEVAVLGTRISGVDLRKALGLNSTRFSVVSRAGEARFTTLGNGHGVGLCQYGADAMAKRGCRFDEILLHYYRGASISAISR